MTVPPGEPRREPPASPMEAARRYPAPHQRPRGNSPAPSRESPPASTVEPSALPKVLGIIGIVCWFLFGIGAIASVILGLTGQRRAREAGQSDLLPRVAWIGGIVVLALNVIGFIVLPSTYSG